MFVVITTKEKNGNSYFSVAIFTEHHLFGGSIEFFNEGRKEFLVEIFLQKIKLTKNDDDDGGGGGGDAGAATTTSGGGCGGGRSSASRPRQLGLCRRRR